MHHYASKTLFILLLLAATISIPANSATDGDEGGITAATLKGLELRGVGPALMGRRRATRGPSGSRL